MAERVYLTVAEVIAIHRLLIEEYGGILGLRDSGALQAAVFRPQTGYYNSVAEEAAALMESLVNNNPFLDGNKRVAFAAVHTFLLLNGQDLDVDPLRAYEFMTTNMASGRFRFGLILDWISSHLKALG
ncbi:MAG TPA: type II toxin-antitoxin system death-on-curing family toxin [Terriglobales bacterium]|nr:type II toxin-antitoxin system death-on-curing family toxin [Terriglobales bacterium]